jgi:diacylglycerol kinase (ATP)
MRKAILLYNPASGQRRNFADVEEASAVMRAGGVDAQPVPTTGAGTAAEQARQAIDGGCDTIFACGGDGTVHDVLQGVVGTEAALGVIPLGTANALAHDLKLPLSPSGAARAALTSKPRRIAVGRVEYQDFSGHTKERYFTVAVGIGADAQLFYKLNPTLKRTLGMVAYIARASWLLVAHKMENFEVEFAADGETRWSEVTQLLGVRIRNFGGVLRELAPGASLHRDDLRLVLFQTRSRATYLGHVVRGLLGVRWRVPGITLVHTTSATCSTFTNGNAGSARIYLEADGELLGTLPASLSMVPDAVNLLVPTR